MATGRVVWTGLGRAVHVAALTLGVMWPAMAGAQSAIEFVPGTRFHIDAQHLSNDDVRYDWDANFFGEIDVIGWKGGRATVTGDYEVVMGNQLRRFDPNQGNYLLEGTVTQRIAGIEVGGQFHHISRHLSDRIKFAAVDWNQLGLRIGKQVVRGKLDLMTRADFRTTVANSLVDYDREVEADLKVRYAVRPRVLVMSNTRRRMVDTDDTRNRGILTGIRTEGGVHLRGSGGALELFLAAERRIDPYPTQFAYATFVAAGFRVVSR